MSTFGNTNIGGSWLNDSGNIKAVDKFTLSEAGDVSKLTIYVRGHNTGEDQVRRGVIYSDTAGSPNALKGTTAEITVTSAQAAGWVDLSFSPSVSLTPGDYWLGYIVGANSAGSDTAYDASSEGVYNNDTYADGASDPFGSDYSAARRYFSSR